MAAAVLLIIEFGIGTGVDLYVTLPQHQGFFSTVFGSALLAAHAVVAVLLAGAAVGALVRAVRSRRLIVPTSVGFAAVVAAGIFGSSFAGNGSNAASLGMALAAVVAMFCYLAAVFRVPQSRPEARDGGS
jgi:CHASE2 domain-containing sensor protein